VAWKDLRAGTRVALRSPCPYVEHDDTRTIAELAAIMAGEIDIIGTDVDVLVGLCLIEGTIRDALHRAERAKDEAEAERDEELARAELARERDAREARVERPPAPASPAPALPARPQRREVYPTSGPDPSVLALLRRVASAEDEREREPMPQPTTHGSAYVNAAGVLVLDPWRAR
jgi:hypothetical protein